jgi:hypothetical protein
LELDLEEGTGHRFVLVVDQVDEQHHSVRVVLDRYELMKPSFGEPGIGEMRSSTCNRSLSKLAANAGRSRTNAITPS